MNITDDYVVVFAPSHPRNRSNVVGQHILVAEKALDKFLPLGAEVHHVNGIRSDNRPRNLVVCPDRKYHRLLHSRTNEKCREFLNPLIAERGLSFADLAKIIKHHLQWATSPEKEVRKMLTGKAGTLRAFYAIAAYLGVNLANIFE